MTLQPYFNIDPYRVFLILYYTILVCLGMHLMVGEWFADVTLAASMMLVVYCIVMATIQIVKQHREARQAEIERAFYILGNRS